jgi:hypothetical protein
MVWQRLRNIQFIAALGDPAASSGVGASEWGLWRVDPGPRGVPLRDYAALREANHQARAGWTLNPNDFWIEEHGRLMEAPDTLPPGRYMVTGDREKTVPLTVTAEGGWSLEGASLLDVTHLPCRSARYLGDAAAGAAASPGSATLSDFPVTPGANMPAIRGCNHKDYAVVFVLAVDA